MSVKKNRKSPPSLNEKPLETFFAALSHELRTPLTAILSWAQLLQTKKISSSLQRGLKVIERNALTQAKLLDDLQQLHEKKS